MTQDVCYSEYHILERKDLVILQEMWATEMMKSLTNMHK